MPANGIITSSCGKRKNPILGVLEIHTGIDISLDENTPVFASKDGKIIETGESQTFGNFLKIATDDGYELFYGHLNKLFVSEEEYVYAGEKIALSGNTGLSTGPHLHFGVYKDNKLCDPMEYIDLPYTDEVTEEYILRGEAIIETKKN
ncbi:MAG: M23 family metallopeptidase [Lachnospiraceae bacterium]|nr:M23 family metallopeptidase [Lachnospiraceae bacterium]